MRALSPAILSRAPLAVLSLCVLGFIASAVWLGAAMLDNRTIGRLAGGHDITPGAGAPPLVLFARAKYLMDRDEFEPAQPLIERVVRYGSATLAADMLYDAGNARLHHAIGLIGDGKFDSAAADVMLARDFYTRALRLQPGFWDAKFNLDIAMRLVRDFPATEIPGEEQKQPTSKLWTDLPGLPKGGP